MAVKSRQKRNIIIRSVLKYLGRLLAVVAALVIIIGVVLISAVYMISTSSCETVKSLFVNTMVETGALDFCAYMFLDEAAVNEIVAQNQMVVPEEKTDTSKIIIGDVSDPEKKEEQEKQTKSEDERLGIVYNEEGVCLLNVKGKTYEGKILIVKDPTRVHVTGLEKYGTGIVGKTTEQMAIDCDALAAINGGGYAEMSDYKTGGIPEGREQGGVVIIDGELRWGSLNTSYEFIGFDENHLLYVDTMTAAEALKIGIVEAVNWGPVLVKNGEPCVVQGTSTNPGFHPRSAIGQRADGSIILLVIDGRQAQSMGASYDDLVEIMVNYGAVNAANLDGGMSSYMYYDGEIVTSPYMLYFNGKRTVATSFIVTRSKNS